MGEEAGGQAGRAWHGVVQVVASEALQLRCKKVSGGPGGLTMGGGMRHPGGWWACCGWV